MFKKINFLINAITGYRSISNYKKLSTGSLKSEFTNPANKVFSAYKLLSKNALQFANSLLLSLLLLKQNDITIFLYKSQHKRKICNALI